MRRKRGTENQAVGRSRGGPTTKILAVVDVLGDLARFVLLPSQRHDTIGVPPLVEGIAFGVLLSDRVFDVDWLRTELDRGRACAVISPKSNRKAKIDYDREMYRWRHLIENYFAKIREFRSIATRYDKVDISYNATICIAATIIAGR